MIEKRFLKKKKKKKKNICYEIIKPIPQQVASSRTAAESRLKSPSMGRLSRYVLHLEKNRFLKEKPKKKKI